MKRNEKKKLFTSPLMLRWKDIVTWRGLLKVTNVTYLMYKMTIICYWRSREHAKLTKWLFLSYYYSQCPLLKFQFRARTFVFILVDPCLSILTIKFWNKSAAAIERSEWSGSPAQAETRGETRTRIPSAFERWRQLRAKTDMKAPQQGSSFG